MENPPADPAPAQGLRQRKKLATRAKLSWTALTLAIEHGLDNLRVEDIAAKADVSPRTFNNYFANKYEAICAITTDRARDIGTVLEQRPDDEPAWEAITAAVIQQYSPENGTSRQWSQRSRRLFAEPALRGEYLRSREIMLQTLAEAIKRRIEADDQDLLPHIAAAAVITATDLAIARWRDGDQQLHEVLTAALRQAGRCLVLP